jgi:hypothetical protein
MKIAIWILIGLVTSVFIKGIFDINLAFENGESPQSIISGAIPMYLLGALALGFLGKVISQINKNESTESSQEQTTEE